MGCIRCISKLNPKRGEGRRMKPTIEELVARIVRLSKRLYLLEQLVKNLDDLQTKEIEMIRNAMS